MVGKTVKTTRKYAQHTQVQETKEALSGGGWMSSGQGLSGVWLVEIAMFLCAVLLDTANHETTSAGATPHSQWELQALGWRQQAVRLPESWLHQGDSSRGTCKALCREATWQLSGIQGVCNPALRQEGDDHLSLGSPWSRSAVVLSASSLLMVTLPPTGSSLGARSVLCFTSVTIFIYIKDGGREGRAGSRSSTNETSGWGWPWGWLCCLQPPHSTRKQLQLTKAAEYGNQPPPRLFLS